MGASRATPQFGIVVSSSTAVGDPVAEAQAAEAAGLDAVSVHRDVLHGSPPSLETWTLLCWLAAHTTTARLVPNVLALPQRHPAVMAKMAESLQRLSGGRLILALGAGGPINDGAFAAFGLGRRSPGEKVAAMEEAIDVIRGLWTGRPMSLDGRSVRVDGALIDPHAEPPIPLWLGAFEPRMLNLVGRKADGWLPSLFLVGRAGLYERLRAVRAAAATAGRDPDELTYGCNVAVRIGDGAGASSSAAQVAGTAPEVADQLGELVRHGFTYLNLSLPAGPDQLTPLAREVLPRLRDRS